MKKRIARVRAKQVSFGVLINICLVVCAAMALTHYGVLKDRARHKVSVMGVKALKTSSYYDRVARDKDSKLVKLVYNKGRDWLNSNN